MRKIGLTALILGFAWLLALQGGVFLRGTRPALHAMLPKLDAQSSSKVYSKNEVDSLIREASIAQDAENPLFFLPGTLMFVGGFICALSHSLRSNA